MMNNVMPSPEDDERTRQAFLERYKAHRSLELDMAKFAAGLERSFLQAAAVLNGGSITVFLSFLGSTADKTKADPYLVLMSFIPWISGLALAIATGWIAYQAQNGFLRSTRNWRHVSGLRVLGEIYRAAIAVSQDDMSASLAERANNLQHEPDAHWHQAIKLGVGSVTLLVTGAALALLTVLTATAVRHVP